MKLCGIRSVFYLGRHWHRGRRIPTSYFIGDLGRYFSQSSDESVISKTFRLTSESLRNSFTARKPDSSIPKETDILVVGGGIMGSSVAYWLKQRAPDSFDICVVERDPTYTRSSSALSVGGIRQQFSIKENIQLSMASANFLRNIRKHLSVLDQDLPDIRFQHHGYLFLATEKGAEQLAENHKVQEECGSKVDLMSPQMLKDKFPWINTDGLALGAYGLENEGWFDPWSLLSAFRSKAISFGTNYIQAELTGFNFRSTDRESPFVPGEYHQQVNEAIIKTPDGNERTVKFTYLVVCAGAFSGEVGRLLRIGTAGGILRNPIPVEPRKRYVYVYHCNHGPGIECPLLIDPSGVYFRREGLGGNYVAGKSPVESEEPDIASLDVDYTFFDSHVWPTLAQRVPAFEAIKVSSAWAGYYDYNTLDQNAIIGRHPYYPNIVFATGFSGHGIQMAPAVGRAVMELLLDRDFQTIDLTRFGVERIVDNQPIYETNIV